MQVIEGAKTGNVPFGFARALAQQNDPGELADIYKVFGGAYGA